MTTALTALEDRSKPDRGLLTPSRHEEMAWSQKTFPSDSTDVVTLISSMLQVAEPLLHSLHVQVEVQPAMRCRGSSWSRSSCARLCSAY